MTYDACHHSFHDECHGQWRDSSYQNKWHMLSSVSLYIMCVMICASTCDAYHRWCDDTWHDSYQNMWCVPQPVYKHMICITASTMMHAMTYARMSQFASRHVMHVTTHVIMHTISHNVTYCVKTHGACHCPCNDTGCVPWLCHRLAMTCVMTHDACHCPCNDTGCVP